MAKLTDLFANCRALFERKHETCFPCEGTGTVCVYSYSDEYAAPCPRCVGPVEFLAKITKREGGYTLKDLAYARDNATDAGREALTKDPSDDR